MSRIASVLLPMPLPEAFDYAEPEGMGLAVGDQVRAPLGPRLLRQILARQREEIGNGHRQRAIHLKLLRDVRHPSTAGPLRDDAALERDEPEIVEKIVHDRMVAKPSPPLTWPTSLLAMS